MCVCVCGFEIIDKKLRDEGNEKWKDGNTFCCFTAFKNSILFKNVCINIHLTFSMGDFVFKMISSALKEKVMLKNNRDLDL